MLATSACEAVIRSAAAVGHIDWRCLKSVWLTRRILQFFLYLASTSCYKTVDHETDFQREKSRRARFSEAVELLASTRK
jgi:hypothetical protein